MMPAVGDDRKPVIFPAPGGAGGRGYFLRFDSRVSMWRPSACWRKWPASPEPAARAAPPFRLRFGDTIPIPRDHGQESGHVPDSAELLLRTQSPAPAAVSLAEAAGRRPVSVLGRAGPTGGPRRGRRRVKIGA